MRKTAYLLKDRNIFGFSPLFFVSVGVLQINNPEPFWFSTKTLKNTIDCKSAIVLHVKYRLRKDRQVSSPEGKSSIVSRSDTFPVRARASSCSRGDAGGSEGDDTLPGPRRASSSRETMLDVTSSIVSQRESQVSSPGGKVKYRLPEGKSSIVSLSDTFPVRARASSCSRDDAGGSEGDDTLPGSRRASSSGRHDARRVRQVSSPRESQVSSP
jgi:hypothetical protein